MTCLRRGRRALEAILLFLIASPLGGCVSAARHQQVLDENARLVKENTELRQRLAEETVRREEAQEAMRRAEGTGTAPKTAPGPSQTGPARAASESTSGTSVPAGHMAGAATTTLQEEDLEGSPDTAPGPATGDAGTLKVARYYRDQGKTREALEAYSRLIRNYPFSALLADAFMERGLLREKEGDRKGALSDFDTVAQAFPQSPNASKARRQAASLRRD